MLQVMLTVYLIPMLLLGTSIDSVILPKMTNYCKKECFKYRRLILYLDLSHSTPNNQKIKKSVTVPLLEKL